MVIATGAEVGTYHAVGESLAPLLVEERVVESARALSTDGTVENLRRLDPPDGEPEVDFAFVQSDANVSENVRLVASLYDEFLHVLIARSQADGFHSIDDLDGHKVFLGAKGSGTRAVALRVIGHFGITPGADVNIGPSELSAAFSDGRVEAAFVLGSLQTQHVRGLCDADLVSFLSLGDSASAGGESDALAAVFPSLRKGVIPTRVYGSLPEGPIATVSVSALLVTRADVDQDLVRDVTRVLFQKRARLATRVRERFDPETTVLPFHDGAVSYFLRDQPYFFVEYADAISLALTLLIGAVSGLISVSQLLRRRRKNRIDAFYREVEKCASVIATAESESLVGLREKLEDIRRRAFQDLVNERLEANESFIIFQDFLRHAFARIDGLLRGETSR